MSAHVPSTAPFDPSAPPLCSRRECYTPAFVRIGELDACGSHTNSAIITQVGGSSSKKLLIGRYQTPRSSQRPNQPDGGATGRRRP